MTRGALLLAGLLAAVPMAAAAAASPWSEQPYALLLVGPDAGQDWNLFVSQVKKRLGAEVRVDAFSGTLEPKDLQKAVDRLQASRVRKIVVLPLFLYSESKELDQLKYLLGIEKLPSRDFMESWGMASRVVQRVKAKPALVLGAPPGGDEVVTAALEARAREGARRGKPETVLLLGQGSQADADNAARAAAVEAHAKRLSKASGLGGARSWLLRPPTREKPRQGADSEKGLKDLVQELTRSGRVVVVPYLLTQDGSTRSWKKVLENPFLRWAEKGILPNEALARWAAEKAQSLSAEPDQARFKNPEALPPQERGRGANPWGQNR